MTSICVKNTPIAHNTQRRVSMNGNAHFKWFRSAGRNECYRTRALILWPLGLMVSFGGSRSRCFAFLWAFFRTRIILIQPLESDNRWRATAYAKHQIYWIVLHIWGRCISTLSSHSSCALEKSCVSICAHIQDLFLFCFSFAVTFANDCLYVWYHDSSQWIWEQILGR